MLLILYAVDQNPHVLEDGLASFKLDIFEDVVTSVSTLSGLLLPDLLFEWVLWTQNRSAVNWRSHAISYIHQVVNLSRRLKILFLRKLFFEVILVLFKERPPLKQILELVNLEVKRALLHLIGIAALVSHTLIII